jgi:glycosyltransferase involved in cell wall biosynthesis
MINNRKRSILIVGISDSIHCVRWIKQIADQNWDIHFFPSIDNGVSHKDLEKVTMHHSIYYKKYSNCNFKTKGFPIRNKKISKFARRIVKEIWPNYRINQLIRLIKKLKPDLVHSMEIQAAGYLVLEAKKRINNRFPPWLVTNWGSDIYLFGKLDDHILKIKEVLERCDYYSCECRRDVSLAKKFGFKGKLMPVLPNSGGFNLNEVSRFRQPGPTSKRKFIMLKGHQGWAGRALVGLRALERCKCHLNEYKIIVYSAKSREMKIALELFKKNTNLNIKNLELGISHKEILKYHGHARISIGLSISDAISTSFLEALIMGSFPIQSNTSCANEWITNNKTGLLVNPDDVDEIQSAILEALNNDILVDTAANQNYLVAKKKLDENLIKKKILSIYSSIFKGQI